MRVNSTFCNASNASLHTFTGRLTLFPLSGDDLRPTDNQVNCLFLNGSLPAHECCSKANHSWCMGTTFLLNAPFILRMFVPLVEEQCHVPPPLLGYSLWLEETLRFFKSSARLKKTCRLLVHEWNFVIFIQGPHWHLSKQMQFGHLILILTIEKD